VQRPRMDMPASKIPHMYNACMQALCLRKCLPTLLCSTCPLRLDTATRSCAGRQSERTAHHTTTTTTALLGYV